MASSKKRVIGKSNWLMVVGLIAVLAALIIATATLLPSLRRTPDSPTVSSNHATTEVALTEQENDEQIQQPRSYLSTPDSTLLAFHRFHNNNDRDSLLTCLLDLRPGDNSNFRINPTLTITIIEIKKKLVFTDRDLEAPTDRVGDVQFDVEILYQTKGIKEGKIEMWSCWMREVRGEWLIYDMATWGYPN